MDKIIRCITSDGGISAVAMDSSDAVFTAQRIHKTSPVATAALGRLLTAASIMGSMLKQSTASITLRINGGGPLGSVIAVADSSGNCRGYVENPSFTLANKPNGKLDVSGAVGTDGLLSVMRDYGTGEPYIGQVPIISGEIAEDITGYYATSEQVPTVCALGVLVDKEDGKVLLSGGFLIQLLPGASQESIDKLEQNIAKLEPVTTMLAKGMDVEQMCRLALEGFELEVLDSFETAYTCNCSRDRVVRAISMLSPDEIATLADETGKAEVQCQFCDKIYTLTNRELQDIAEKIKN